MIFFLIIGIMFKQKLFFNKFETLTGEVKWWEKTDLNKNKLW